MYSFPGPKIITVMDLFWLSRNCVYVIAPNPDVQSAQEIQGIMFLTFPDLACLATDETHKILAVL